MILVDFDFRLKILPGRLFFLVAMVGFMLHDYSDDALVPGSQLALRVLPAETRLTVYRWRLVSKSMIFRCPGYRRPGTRVITGTPQECFSMVLVVTE